MCTRLKCWANTKQRIEKSCLILYILLWVFFHSGESSSAQIHYLSSIPTSNIFVCLAVVICVAIKWDPSLIWTEYRKKTHFFQFFFNLIDLKPSFWSANMYIREKLTQSWFLNFFVCEWSFGNQFFILVT